MVIRSHEMCQFGIDFPYHSSYDIMEEYLSTTTTDKANDARVTLMLKNLPSIRETLFCARCSVQVTIAEVTMRGLT